MALLMSRKNPFRLWKMAGPLAKMTRILLDLVIATSRYINFIIRRNH
ncbi:hypothetical protein Bhyg_14510, partial [Pseudolycoriella hygida]